MNAGQGRAVSQDFPSPAARYAFLYSQCQESQDVFTQECGEEGSCSERSVLLSSGSVLTVCCADAGARHTNCTRSQQVQMAKGMLKASVAMGTMCSHQDGHHESFTLGESSLSALARSSLTGAIQVARGGTTRFTGAAPKAQALMDFSSNLSSSSSSLGTGAAAARFSTAAVTPPLTQPEQLAPDKGQDESAWDSNVGLSSLGSILLVARDARWPVRSLENVH